MKTVEAYLQGGLGNQCFIYAAARAMALDAGARVVLRGDRFVGDGYKRQFSLDDFHCDYELKSARPKVVRLMHYYYHAVIKKLGRWRLFNTINEKVCFSYHPMPTSWVGRISIDGYWQSEKYFERHAGEIAADFRLKDDSWLKQDKLAQQILADDKSVFLHVRSYKDIPQYKDGSCALPISYYEKAIAYLREEVAGGTIYVFSDDLPWAIERLGAIAAQNGFVMVPVVPDGNLLPKGKYSSSYLRDFTLMRLCRHGIIADSSFSWWAGWLGEHEWLKKDRECLRIRPDKMNVYDFYPERWIKV